MSMGFIVMEINLHNVLILQYSCSSTTVCAKHQMINQSINISVKISKQRIVKTKGHN